MGRTWSGWQRPSTIASKSRVEVKFCPSLLCVRFSDFEIQFLQNYHIDINHIFGMLVRAPRCFRIGSLNNHQPLQQKWRKCKVSIIFLIFFAIKSCTKVYQNTIMTIICSDIPICLYKKSSVGVQFQKTVILYLYLIHQSNPK